MKKYSFLLLVFIISITVMGQQQTSPPEEKPNIEVTGSAEMEIIPDEIFVSIVLREKNKNNDKSKIEVQEDNLLKKLKENGFDTKNLSLSGADGELQYGVFRITKVLTEKRLQMKVGNAGEVNKLFQLLDELEIEEANILKTSHSQIEKFRKEIKTEAMKAAKNKADYLLDAIGEQRSKPLFIREQDNSPYLSNQSQNSNLQQIFKTGYGGKNQGTGFENEIAFTKIKIRYEIFARFEIK
ncbi:MAG: SIMPL domain-containing protein [Chitinophagaceae bacterium]